jgi:hypothetical protein
VKYVCLGYFDANEWNTLGAVERDALVAECRAFDEELRRAGRWAGGDVLQTARNAVTLRYGDGGVLVTDGPYAQTKEQIGGILYLEARDLNEAIQLVSRHPGVRIGPWEIRPIENLEAFSRQLRIGALRRL